MVVKSYETFVKESESLVRLLIFFILSKVKHVKFCLKTAGPPANPKPYLWFDSVRVP